MKIKHSKFKNTGLIYELLVKQITSDLVARKDSPAVNILRKYYSGNSPLVQEWKLYKTIQEGTNLTTIKADNLLSATTKAAKRINLAELKKIKYSIISELRGSYDLESFFSVPVANYKTLAAFYCLLEAERSQDLIDPQSIVNNRVTLLEAMTCRYQSKEEVTDSLIEEYSNYDKDLRLLTFKVLLEKFNERYGDLLPEQKNILKQFITLGESKALRTYMNEELSKILGEIRKFSTKIPKGIENIKLQEVLKMSQLIPNTEKVSDEHLVNLLRLYDLLAELKTL